MRAIFSFSIIVIFLAASCETSPPVSDLQNGIVNGIVSEKTTDAGIPNAIVYLLGNEGGGTWGGGGSPSFEIDQTVSDANGNFSFLFDYNGNYGYYCTAIAEKYFNYYNEVPVDEDKVGVNNVEVKLQPIGYLRLNLKNVIPYNESDKIAINGAITFSFVGDILDTILIFSVLGNYENFLYWGVTKNLTTIVYGDTLYCRSFDTTDFEIFY
ncbi:MAG: hypothetical protein IPG60_05055 [Bacteroidetes bacterium]|nr:hypothetical protein [Bacteroidota bacterium]MBP7400009.1 hypothetical protein [Chitinophagales bacterium]MBP9190572.1 hypothetical protein [Chitinophagales bacterium]MBP9550049.1 hypothetical protein [Chitinophagales bacterium]